MSSVPVAAVPGTGIPQADHDTDDGRFSAAVAAVSAAFGDPTRRDIFLHVRAQPGLTATEVAYTFSLHPNVARHHLQRLVDGGYLRVETSRKAPGAGRPSKQYFCVEEELTVGLMQRRDDLLMRLLAEAMQRLGLEEAEKMAAHVGEEYGRSLAARMTPTEGQRTIRAAMHVVADTLTAHGFAAHAEDRGETTAVVAEQCPFGNASTTNPVLCAVDRGMVTGLLAGLCGQASERALPVILSSRPRRCRLYRLGLSARVRRTYLDHASTTPPRPEVLAALTRWMTMPAADPGRLHAEGRVVRDALEEARQQVATLVGAAPREVVVHLGWHRGHQRRRLGSDPPAPGRPGALRQRRALGRTRRVRTVGADRGHSRRRDRPPRRRRARVPVGDAPLPRPALVHCQWANHEVGTLQPVHEVVDLCRAAGVPVHVDAAAACGHVPIDLS